MVSRLNWERSTAYFPSSLSQGLMAALDDKNRNSLDNASCSCSWSESPKLLLTRVLSILITARSKHALWTNNVLRFLADVFRFAPRTCKVSFGSAWGPLQVLTFKDGRKPQFFLVIHVLLNHHCPSNSSSNWWKRTYATLLKLENSKTQMRG